MTEQEKARLSRLADMLVYHIIYTPGSNRSAKALKIAQYLRRVLGDRHVHNLRINTGYRE
jgi:hypothetical protein